MKKNVPDFILRYYRDYRRRREMKAHAGDNVYCPVCGSCFAEFGTYGLIARKNTRCYYCGSLERHRLLWKYFNDKTNLLDGTAKCILHVAPEKSFYDIFQENSALEYIPCDLFPERYNYNGKVGISKVDLTEIPFDENTFDVVLCSHVLEHIPDDKLAMSELYRVMKKGAWAVLQVPVDYSRETTYEDFTITTPKGREKAFGQNDHVRCYGRDYKNKLESIGFKVIEDDYVTKFSVQELYKYGLMPSELIYFCRK
ncbi:MAG: class I SAM-dependent methyltransferase [Bacteroidales bacterium]|nr:class I SAM-dependent methyltransferase [Bacteroidales bacterium]